MTISLLIVGIFLTCSLIHGLFSGKGINTFKTFAVGNKNFKTSTLIATLVATNFGGGFLLRTLQNTYISGLFYALPILIGGITCLLIIGQLMTVRMKECLHHLSIAESMGALFGNSVRMITALVSILFCAGAIGIQLQVIAKMMHSFLGVSGSLTLYIAVGILLVYSIRGGVRAVTFTDVIQFITFASLLLTLIYLVGKQIHSFESVSHLFTENENFALHKVARWTPKFKNALGLFLVCIIPSLGPASIQRLFMASDVWQARRTLTYTGVVYFILYSLVIILGLLLRASSAHLEPDKLLYYMLSLYPAHWLTGLMCIGILALAMSTADSCMNTAAVLFAHDIAPFFKSSLDDQNKLKLAKLFTLILGIMALFFAFYKEDTWQLLLFIESIYTPIVSIPFIMAVFGFRPRGRSVLLGMGAGSLTTISFNHFGLGTYLKLEEDGVSPIIIALLMHWLFLMGSHYLVVPNKQLGKNIDN